MCSSCGQKSVRIVSPQRAQEIKTQNVQPLIAPKSDNTVKVQLRYIGGGMTRQTTGCSSCGSVGKYALTTSETIQFASDDAPNGWFSQRFDTAHTYWVTERQAEYLLRETFTNPSGQVIHKFQRVE